MLNFSPFNTQKIKRKFNFCFFGKHQKYFIECVENISNFTSASEKSYWLGKS